MALAAVSMFELMGFLMYLGVIFALIICFKVLKVLADVAAFFTMPLPPQVVVPLSDLETKDSLPDNFPKFDYGMCIAQLRDIHN